jgi:hypothetical protein
MMFMDTLRYNLTVGIGRTALVISKWIVPVLGVFIAYRLFLYFFVTDWNHELLKGVVKCDMAKVQKALKNGANVESKDKAESPAIVLAAKNNQNAIVSVLLSAGAKPDSRDDGGKSALTYACRKGYVDIAQLLLAKRADPNLKCFEGTTPLIVAACK